MGFLKKVLCLLIYNSSFPAVAQVDKQVNSIGEITNLDQAKYSKVMDKVNFDDVENNQRINYGRINGSPFWKDDWKSAYLVLSKDQVFKADVRLNLVTKEIHFLMNDEELVADNLNFTKVIVYDNNDTVTFIRDIPDLFLNRKKLDAYLQVLNTGAYQLLKYTNRRVSSADSLFGTQKKYFFSDNIYYFLNFKDRTERIKKLNRENILSFLPSASKFAGWASDNKIDFNKETDVIRFLNYYNRLTPAN
jgi:hypothetical protein